MNVTELHYETAKRRFKELAKSINGTTPATDERIAELTMMSDLIKDYERKNFPYGRPTVGDLIRHALEEKGMTQRQLAAEIGASPSRINDFVSGKSEPALKTAAKICDVLQIPAAVMLGI